MFYLMGTGSRSMITDPNAAQHYKITREVILTFREEYGDELILISGLAEGFDEAIAKVGMREGIPYIAAVPNPGYGQYYWGNHSLLGTNRMDTFNELLSCAQEIVYVCKGIYENGLHANFVRNQWMVNRANYALVYSAGSSGTRDCVGRLKSKHVPYIEFPFTSRLQGKLEI
jgi:hypothetical protein